MRPEFKRLFEPGNIGTLQVKNRIIMPPMATHFYTKEGGVTERLINYYSARARGGVGLIIVECTFPRSPAFPTRLRITSDDLVPGFRRLVQAVHEHGAKVIIQLNPHRGRVDESEPASASAVPHPVTGITPKVLSREDIKELVAAYGEGVRRAKEAGFDGVMIHGGTGYLVSEFLSPRVNKRTDEYGGDIRRRARFALELLEITRQKAGHDFPVMYRIVADERVAGGFNVKDAIEVGKILEEAGINGIDVMSGVAETFEYIAGYMYIPPGYNTHLSRAIKKDLHIPVSVAGRIETPQLAEQILQSGMADFVDLGRTLIADPEWPNKAAAGRVSEIRRCLACNRCLEFTMQPGGIPLACTVNPAVGYEKEFAVAPLRKPKKVLVIGGGPAGMQAALTCAERGHSVTLWEAEKSLGGQLSIAHVPPDKGTLKDLLQYLREQVAKSGIRIETGKEASASMVLEFAPDAVILALGSRPFIPAIEGINNKNVITGREVLTGSTKIGNSVAIVGGGRIGCEIAEFLVQKGKTVSVIEILPELAADEALYTTKKLILQRLNNSGVKCYPGVKSEKITVSGIEFRDKENRPVTLQADTIIMATGSVPNTDNISAALAGKVPEVYRVGDCVKPARIWEAISEGAQTALKI